MVEKVRCVFGNSFYIKLKINSRIFTDEHPRPLAVGEPAVKRAAPPAFVEESTIQESTLHDQDDVEALQQHVADLRKERDELLARSNRILELEQAMAAMTVMHEATLKQEQEARLAVEKKVASLTNELDISRRHAISLETNLKTVEAERDSLTDLVTTMPDDDNKVEQLASTLVQVTKERERIAEERDRFVCAPFFYSHPFQ